MDFMISQEQAGHAVFPPDIVIQIKALACELPARHGIPLSRFTCNEIATQAVSRGIVAQISGTTVWRWLNEDAINLGNIGVGYSLEIRHLNKKPGVFWICTTAFIKVRPWQLMNL